MMLTQVIHALELQIEINVYDLRGSHSFMYVTQHN